MITKNCYKNCDLCGAWIRGWEKNKENQEPSKYITAIIIHLWNQHNSVLAGYLI